MPTNNIYLIGFMASGKSFLAKELAKSLDYQLLDTDEYIVQKEQLSISEIFAQKNEDYFRHQEYQALQYCQNLTNHVIPIGAGAVSYFSSFCLISKLKNVFFLDTPLSLIKQRLVNQNERPLYDNNLQQRYYARLSLYKQLGLSINTYNKSVDSLVIDIKNIVYAQEKIINHKFISIKNNEKSYLIHVGKNYLADIKSIIDSLNLRTHKIAIITNNNIANILNKSLKKLITDLNCELIILKDKEKHKNLNSVNYCYEQLLLKKFNRQSLILAFGGGVIGDMAGFVAATYMRGVPFIQIPTTLLACIDSSIGGKTAIDTELGKNLIGAFYNPSAVIIDENLLSTLPKEEYNQAMAEIIKHALIFDETFFDEILYKDLSIHELIIRSLNIKKIIVEEDFHEQHIRAYLNFGHTFGHALENISNYQLRHGEAIAIGMMMEIKLSLYLGVLKEDFTKQLKLALSKFNLSESYLFNSKEILKALVYDKKNVDDKIGFILPVKKGKVQKFLLEQKVIEDFLATL